MSLIHIRARARDGNHSRKSSEDVVVGASTCSAISAGCPMLRTDQEHREQHPQPEWGLAKLLALLHTAHPVAEPIAGERRSVKCQRRTSKGYLPQPIAEALTLLCSFL
ncbi:hypothetical protein EK904_004562 [Melospiza melodia maxima]|nr:hypothetical protein EK904_004562 [Melospiza melodia maxima]